MQATYSPEDNKLRLYSESRLDTETYARVRAAGFIWAPKQQLFVAPAWSPSRADLLEELAGEIGDEDKTLVERAEERAERFEDYSDRRAADANAARAAVHAIADNIPLGQPILVGHHSEKHARRDAEKIENGMRRAVKMWETSQYWTSRAAGALRAAKYKEKPAVRARRIKTIEADKRKREREVEQVNKCLEFWRREGITLDAALNFANYCDHYGVRLKTGETSWSIWSALQDGKITLEDARAERLETLPAMLAYRARWISHYENRLAYERAMLEDAGGIASDQVKPEKGGACKCWASHRGGWSYITKVNKVSVTVLDNWGNGGANFTRTIPFDKLSALMAAADVDAARAAGSLVEYEDKTGFALVERAPVADPEPIAAPAESGADPEPHAGESFEAMRETLRAGVKVVAAPQLFPTPAELARRMVEVAGIGPDHRVLEPSAGTGAILREMRAADRNSGCDCAGEVVAVELNVSLTSNLERYFQVTTRCADFLETSADELGGAFDRVVMNPPFENAADIKHIKHAFSMLRPGGRLVAICANGPRQAEQLRPMVEDNAGEWIELPADTFKDAGTSVRTVLLVMNAPAPAEKPKSHLTLTGYDAGRTLCGAVKDASVSHYHASYAPDCVLASPDLCPECLRLWNESAEDAPADPEQELRDIWTAKGVPQEKQDAIIADITAKASPAALDAMFSAPAPEPWCAHCDGTATTGHPITCPAWRVQAENAGRNQMSLF